MPDSIAPTTNTFQDCTCDIDSAPAHPLLTAGRRVRFAVILPNLLSARNLGATESPHQSACLCKVFPRTVPLSEEKLWQS